ncbi:MAG: hypothetical protein R3Y67_10185 [Eubacteriales bacterium]
MLRKKGLRYTIDDMTVVLYDQGSENDLASLMIIAGQLLDVEWIDNLILSCKFFKEDDEEYFENWKKEFADTRKRSAARKERLQMDKAEALNLGETHILTPSDFCHLYKNIDDITELHNKNLHEKRDT